SAFLQESIRELGLSDATVATARFEEVAQQRSTTAELVTVRAVRPDRELWDAAADLLKPTGSLLLFQSDSPSRSTPHFDHVKTVDLIRSPSSQLSIYRRRE